MGDETGASFGDIELSVLGDASNFLLLLLYGLNRVKEVLIIYNLVLWGPTYKVIDECWLSAVHVILTCFSRLLF